MEPERTEYSEPVILLSRPGCSYKAAYVIGCRTVTVSTGLEGEYWNHVIMQIIDRIVLKMYYRKFFNRYLLVIPAITALMVLCISSVNLYAEDFHSEGNMIEVAGYSYAVKNFAGVEMVLITGAKFADFWIGRYEVTQELYESVMKTNPSYFKGNLLPVEHVSWFNAVEFCNKLSIKSGFKPYYKIEKKPDDPENGIYSNNLDVDVIKNADGFRLPESEEWEYAARAGSTGKYYWGDKMNGDYCWYSDNSDKKTHPVGTRKPNRFGIFDIIGNVREWCYNFKTSAYGLSRLVRDGHYSLDEDDLQLDKSDFRSPQLDFGFIGIRLVKNK